MEKLKKQNVENIQAIFEEKTGVNVKGQSKFWNYAVGKRAGGVIMAAGVLACFGVAFVFSQSKMPESTLITGESAETYMVDMPQMSREADGIEVTVYAPALAYDDWVWPTVSERISASFALKENGAERDHDHINIAGQEGDEIYAVAAGTITETGFDAYYGNYIVIDFGGGVGAKYGHLKEIMVTEGAAVEQGQKIGLLGKTGMATGPNLSFTVYTGGMTVNPLAK